MYNETRREDVRHVLVAALCVRRAVRRAGRMCAQISGGRAPLGADENHSIGAFDTDAAPAFCFHGLGRPLC